MEQSEYRKDLEVHAQVPLFAIIGSTCMHEDVMHFTLEWIKTVQKSRLL